MQIELTKSINQRQYTIKLFENPLNNKAFLKIIDQGEQIFYIPLEDYMELRQIMDLVVEGVIEQKDPF